MNKKFIFSIDFDGTICENKYPFIGEINKSIIESILKLKENGHTLILNTCRNGKYLDEAIEFCNNIGITFDYINANEDGLIKKYGECRKISADFYLDDRNISFESFVRLADELDNN